MKKILYFTYISIIVAFVFAVPEHVVDPDWPPHARNHVLQALIWLIGFCILNIYIIAVPLSKDEKWAKKALFISGVFFFAGYFISNWVTQGGAPGYLDDIFLGALGFCYFVALSKV